MLGGHVTRRGAEGELGVEAGGPAIAVAGLVAVRAAEDGHVVVGQVHAGVIPWVAVAAVARLHGDERGLGGIARGVFEERSRGGGVVLAADERGEGRNTSGFAEALEDRASLASLIGEVGAGWGVGREGRRGVLQELRVEEGQRLFERVGFGPRDRTLDGVGIESVTNQTGDQEVDGILKATSVVTRVAEDDAVLGSRGGRRGAFFLRSGRQISTNINIDINLVLFLELGPNIGNEVYGLEVVTKFHRALEMKFMALWYHAKQSIDRLRHLILGAGDGHHVAGKLGAREFDLAVPFLLQLVDLSHAGQQLTVIQTVDNDSLGDVFGINLLDHIHDLLLDKVQALSVASRGPADNVVNLDVIIFLAHTTTVHGVGELHEDRVLLHDALDMLSTNPDDPLVVLVRHMEGNGSRHLLLHQIQTVLSRLVLVAAHVNVEVVLVETVKDDLDVACMRVSNTLHT